MADLLKVMEREMLHSEHAAECFIAAKRRDSARKKVKCLHPECNKNLQGPCSAGQCQFPERVKSPKGEK